MTDLDYKKIKDEIQKVKTNANEELAYMRGFHDGVNDIAEKISQLIGEMIKKEI